MTVSEFIKKYLFDNGLMVPEAAQVVELAKQDELLKDLKWEDDTDVYPTGFLSVVIISVNAIALKWIDANMPKAWFRSMFEPQSADTSENLDWVGE